MIVVYGVLNTLTKLDTPEGHQFPVVSSKFPLIRAGAQGFFLLKRTPTLSWFIVNWIPADPEVIKDDK